MALLFFGSFLEVEAAMQFKPDNPVSIEDFESIVGGYRDERDDILCQLEAKGVRCRHAHNEGVVVQLKNGTWSNVGWICARDKFKNDSRFSQEKTKFLEARNRHATEQVLQAKLAEKQCAVESLRLAKIAIAKVDESVRRLSVSLPDDANRNLVNAARTKNFEVAISVREEYFEEVQGRRKKLYRWRRESIGSLRGMMAWGQRRREVRKEIEEVLLAFEHATIDASVKTRMLTTWNKSLSKWKRLVADAEQLKEQYDELVDRQNLLLLCATIADDRARRITAAIASFAHSDEGWLGENGWSDIGRRVEAEFRSELVSRFKEDVRFG